MRIPRRVLFGLGLSLTVACSGTVADPSANDGSDEGGSGGDNGGGEGGDAAGGSGSGGTGTTEDPKSSDYRAPAYSCNGKDSTKQKPLRRLSRLQLANSVTDVVTFLMGNNAASVLSSVKGSLDKLPPDKYTSVRNKGRDGFSTADHEVTQQHADVQISLAISLGAAMNDSEAKRAALWGSCATDATTANDVTCVDAFLKEKAPRILRSPLTDADVSFYRSALRGTVASQEALADVITLLFASPRFFFQVESQTKTDRLPNSELASRLAYQIWDSPPDQALLAAAADGSIATTDGYLKQVDRLLASPKATTTMKRFYTEWFSLYLAPNLNAGLRLADYKTLVGNDKPTDGATAAMVDDVLNMVGDIFSADRPMIDFLTDHKVYSTEPYLSSVYGLSAPTDGSTGPREPKSSARVGLITRPAFLAYGDYSSHPILKGVRLRTALLCQLLPPAPADAIAKAEATKLPDGPNSQRTAATVLTSPPGCLGCHAQFNPLGFATENFDSLGRERSKELVVGADGKVMGELPIDTSIVPNVDEQDTKMVSGAEGLMQSIVRSRRVEACFSAQYFRFSLGIVEEDEATDGCVLAELEKKARAGASIKEIVRTFVQSSAFTQRTVD
jgi:hypothetical protein